MTETDHFRKAVHDFRIIVGSGTLKGTLLAASVACDEAKAALYMAGHQDDQLVKDLAAMRLRLQTAASAGS